VPDFAIRRVGSAIGPVAWLTVVSTYDDAVLAVMKRYGKNSCASTVQLGQGLPVDASAWLRINHAQRRQSQSIQPSATGAEPDLMIAGLPRLVVGGMYGKHDHRLIAGGKCSLLHLYRPQAWVKLARPMASSIIRRKEREAAVDGVAKDHSKPGVPSNCRPSQNPSASRLVKTSRHVRQPSCVLYRRDWSPGPLDSTMACCVSHAQTLRKSSFPAPCGTAQVCQCWPPSSVRTIVPPVPLAQARADHHTPISTKWTFKRKSDVSAKGRIVARGFSQKPQKHFDERQTAAPVAPIAIFRFLFAIAAAFRLAVASVDYSTAYLNSVIKELLYVLAPPGYLKRFYPQLDPDKYCLCSVRLHKALYGLRQLAFLWFITLSSAFVARGFQRTLDPCTFYRVSGEQLSIVSWHVDDVIMICSPSILD